MPDCRNGTNYRRENRWKALKHTRFNGSSSDIAAQSRHGPPLILRLTFTGSYEKKLEALRACEAVFSGDQAQLLDKYTAEDRYIGSLVGVRYAEAFKAASPLLVGDPEVFSRSRFG